MSSRGWKLDLVACGLLLGGLLVALSLFSYDPADPPGTRIYPVHNEPANLLGAPGAWLAHHLLETFGLAAYVLVALGFVVVFLLFLRRRLLPSFVRVLGWALLVPVAAVTADIVPLPLEEAPLSGGGGSLGAWLHATLDANCPDSFGIFVLAGAGLLGVAFAANFALRPLARLGWRLLRGLATFTWGIRNAASLPKKSDAAPREPRSLTLPARQPRSKNETPVDDSIPINYPDSAAGAETAPRPNAALVPIQRSSADVSEEERFADYELPSLSLLEEPQPFPYEEHDQMLRERAALLEKTFADFSLNVRVVGINTGPVITQYEVALETGLRVHKVTGLGDDLALNLKVPSVRIVAPIPGKNTVGIEIPNEHRAVVRLKEVIRSSALSKVKIPLFLGKDTEGRPLVYDLAEMPHLLIAGRTGTGKSVCMNAIILSMLMTRRPDEVKMIMIDPKKLEMSEYGKIPHLMHPVVDDMKKAEAILAWAVDKMEERYDVLSRARVRSIAGYNELSPAEIHRRLNPANEEERRAIPERMPYIVIFIDEMADLMMQMKKEVEGHIIRLAQKSRAAGIHLVVATQKPTVDVITGLIKSNLPSRICFQVASRSDSRVVLDEMGADKLLGKGDMLFLAPGTSTLIRAQGTYASDREISRVVEFLETDEPCFAAELMQLKTDRDGEGEVGGTLAERLRSRDELYEQAVEIIVREGRGSVSLLQRYLGIGYGKAARFIDYMAEDGIVGTYNGSQAREVLYTPEQWEEVRGGKQEVG
jgi:S-DNA-T family DNA segregation ATPase FtsK/SpoIIIE